jgi:hypothetical protein
MISFIEKFQSKEDEEEDNSSWLYPLLYSLLAIFLIVFSAFIGFWMSKKSFQPRVIYSGQNISSYNAPKGRKKFIEYFTKKKNTPQYAQYYNASTGKMINQPISRPLTQQNINERNESFGGNRRKKMNKKK